MLQRFSFLSWFFSKLACEILPAVIASVIGGLLFSHYARPPVAPAAAVAAPASAEMMQMVRDEHDLIVNYLKKANETRQQTARAAEQEMLKSKAAEQGAMRAASEAQAAESKALAIAEHASAKPERKVAVKPPSRNLDKIVAAEPLQLHAATSAASPIQPAVQSSTASASAVTLAQQGGENILTAKFHDVAALVGRIPVWAHSAAEWLTPRPLTQLLDRDILKISL
jgi:hypothetical protein